MEIPVFFCGISARVGIKKRLFGFQTIFFLLATFFVCDGSLLVFFSISCDETLQFALKCHPMASEAINPTKDIVAPPSGAHFRAETLSKNGFVAERPNTDDPYWIAKVMDVAEKTVKVTCYDREKKS